MSLPPTYLQPLSVYEDERGWGYSLPAPRSISNVYVTFSKRGVLRGLHYQDERSPQKKYLRVMHGRIFDVTVDLRASSPAFGKHKLFVMDGKNENMLIIPRGYAHGFYAHTDCVLEYLIDGPVVSSSAHVLAWDDPALEIEWPHVDPVLSHADRHGKKLTEAVLFP